MAKEDNDKLKSVEVLFDKYYFIVQKMLNEKPTTFRTEPEVIESLLELYNQFILIDKNGIYNNNKEKYLKIALKVYEGMAFFKLRSNSFIEVNGERINYDNIIDKDNMKLVVASKEEIKEAVTYFKNALEVLEDLKRIFPADIYDIQKFRIYHNLEEAYQIYDNDEYYSIMEKAADEGDLFSACNLLLKYCDNEFFSISVTLEKYRKTKEIINAILERQIKDGVVSFKEECEPIFGKSGYNVYKAFNNIDKVVSLNHKREKYEMNESLFINSVLDLIDTLCNNSYVDEALQIINEFLEKYIKLASWDSRFENEFKKKVKKCNELLLIKNSEVLPSDDSLACILPEALKIMDSKIKTFIGTSLVIMKYCNKFTDFTLDYSPSVISLFKALEQILYKISYEGYYKFLKLNISRYDLNHSCLDYSIFDYENKKLKELENFDIGTGLSLLCLIVRKEETYEVEGIKRKRFVREIVKPKTGVLDYLKYNKIDKPYEKIMDFCRNVEDCRFYRNKTAHKDIVERSTAEEAKAIILDTVKLINKAYVYFPNILKKD